MRDAREHGRTPGGRAGADAARTGLAQALAKEVDRVLPGVVALRRRLHAAPELAGQEGETRAALLRFLERTDFTPRRPLLGTDLVLDLGRGRGRLAFRADMDGLPLAETARRAHASRNGCMHACGHDGHMAILAGTALVLSRFRADLPRPLRLVFQPGEEVAALGRDLVARGVLDGVAEVHALHAWPSQPAGTIRLRPGPMFAAGSFFEVTFRGRGGHGAWPERARSPVRALAALARDLETLRFGRGPEDPVLALTAVQAGQTNNVIPAEGRALGGIRYFREEDGADLRARLRAAVAAARRHAGVRADLAFSDNYDLVCRNDPALAARLLALGRGGLFRHRVGRLARPLRGSEDFAYYLRAVPGCMSLLGMGPACAPLHNPAFDFNDAAIRPAILWNLELALAGPA